MTIEKTDAAVPRRSPFALLAVAALSAALGFAAVYVTLGRPDNREPESVKVNTPDARAVTGEGAKTLATGPMTAFVFKAVPEVLPEVTFTDGAGAPKSLKDFRGKAVLLNLWATWCAPCREEMPSLDRLQKALGSDTFQVVALALDRGGAEAARKFLDDIKVERLDLYVDSSTRAGPALEVIGMPTTLLIDKDGREIGRLPGPAAWDSPEAKRLITAALR
jgi:thiol-disulfide isomerase/thioredoxin